MSRIELSDMIVALRRELLDAQAKAEDEDLKFNVDSIEVEAQVTVSTETNAGGGVKFKFLVFGEGELNAGGTSKSEAVQTIRLKLIPEQTTPEGKTKATKVHR